MVEKLAQQLVVWWAETTVALKAVKRVGWLDDGMVEWKGA
jgi:hypothetical protein